MKLTLQQLSEQTEVPGRTVRFYIQKGLLPAPEGARRGAYYTQAHLADILRIKQWQEAGLSLDAIAGLLQARQEPAIELLRPGTVEVRSHLIVADGIELVVNAERAGLTQAQLRTLFQAVQAAHQDLLEHIDVDADPYLCDANTHPSSRND